PAPRHLSLDITPPPVIYPLSLHDALPIYHEYTNENIMLPATTDAEQALEIGRAAHGLTVVELERKNKNFPYAYVRGGALNRRILDRKSTRLNSSHVKISYAVFCLKKKKNK